MEPVTEKTEAFRKSLLQMVLVQEAARHLLRDAVEMRLCLESITSNTCCDGCMEAAKVAAAALQRIDTGAADRLASLNTTPEASPPLSPTTNG